MNLLLLIQDASVNTFLELFKSYGLTGIGFGVLLAMMIRQNKAAEKRISDLEAAQEAQYKAHLDDQKETINDYVELVRQKIQVLSDLTGCLKAMKDTLERMERKSDEK